MTSGLVIPHASGARVVVDSLRVSDAWGYEFPPNEVLLSRTLVSARGQDTSRPCVRPLAHGGPSTPRWLASASSDVHVDDKHERVLFQWFTNDAMIAPVEQVLVAGMQDIALAGDTAPQNTSGSPSPRWLDAASGIGMHSVTLRFGVPAISASPYGCDHLIVDDSIVDDGALVLASAFFVEHGRYHSIEWLTPALGAITLDEVVRAAFERVPWDVLTTRINA